MTVGREKASKIHIVVDTPGHSLALHVTRASAEDRGEVERFIHAVQALNSETVERVWVDQGYTG